MKAGHIWIAVILFCIAVWTGITLFCAYMWGTVLL